MQIYRVFQHYVRTFKKKSNQLITRESMIEVHEIALKSF